MRPKLPIMCGNATFTTLTSITEINAPNTSDTATSQRLTASARRRADMGATSVTLVFSTEIIPRLAQVSFLPERGSRGKWPFGVTVYFSG